MTWVSKMSDFHNGKGCHCFCTLANPLKRAKPASGENIENLINLKSQLILRDQKITFSERPTGCLEHSFS